MKHMSRTCGGIAVTAVAALTVAGCQPAGPAEDPGRSIVVAVPSAGWGNWDPVEGGSLIWGMNTAQPVYESLLEVNVTTLEYEPLLAEEFVIGDDRRSISFTLRDGIEFTDGEPLTAEAVTTSYDAITAGGVNYAANELKSYGLQIEVTGELSLEFTTTSGIDTRFLDALTYMPIVSPAAIVDPETLATNPVGTGPYVLGKTVPDVSQEYVRNTGYWNPDAVDFETVTYQVFADRVAAANALKSGQIDVARIDIGQVAELEAAGFTIASGGGEVMTLVWMDRTGAVQPALADVRVRQAISHAFDRETILESLNLGYGRVSSQNFVEGQPEYIEGGDDRYQFDTVKARELLAEAGYPDGFDITIPTFSGFAPYEPLVVQTLADIGIRATFETVPDDQIGGAISSQAYPLILIWMPAHGLVAYLDENAYFNNWGPADAVIADLIDRINGSDPEDSARASQEFGELMLDEAWYIPFSWRYDTWALAPGLELEVGNRAGWPTGLLDLTAAE